MRAVDGRVFPAKLIAVGGVFLADHGATRVRALRSDGRMNAEGMAPERLLDSKDKTFEWAGLPDSAGRDPLRFWSRSDRYATCP